MSGMGTVQILGLLLSLFSVCFWSRGEKDLKLAKPIVFDE